jgi:hypothetical protein
VFFLEKMVDKLEVRIPRGTEYTPAFADLYGEIAHSEKWRSTFRPAQHYLHTADLREFGHDVMLHSFNRHKEGDHKLELLNTGEKTYSEMLHEIERIFIGANPEGLDVMRIDSAVDVPGVGVDWFQKTARARYKQFAYQCSKIQMDTMGKREVQTIYFGKKPNCIRIYNKTAEHEHQYSKLLRKIGDNEIPAFSEIFGCEKDAIKTRVERQMAAGRVPKKYTIVSAVKKHFHQFNPFDKLEFIKASRLTPEPRICDFPSLKDYAAAMYFREKCGEMGMDLFRKWVNFHTGRNWKTFYEKFGHYLPAPEQADGAGVTEQELFDRYRESLTRQMAA